MNRSMITVLSVLAMAVFAVGCSSFSQSPQLAGKNTKCSGVVVLLTAIMEKPHQAISPDEKAGLVKMREEEKLARDVYRFLGDQWGLRVFNNIIQSEEKHMELVKTLLGKYNIPEPVIDDTSGFFTDSEMKSLYIVLTSKGKKSVIDALQVGMIIEDLDIKDLQNELAKADNEDIRLVYQNLLKGSRNHMRAFSRQLKMNNGSYKAKYLSQTEIDQIISSPQERGPVDEKGKPMVFSSGMLRSQ